MGYAAFHLYVTSLDLLQVCNDQSSLASDSCFSSLVEMHWSLNPAPSAGEESSELPAKHLWTAHANVGAKEKGLYYPPFCQSWIITKSLHWFQQNEGNLPHFCKRAFVNYLFFFNWSEEKVSRFLCCWETSEEHYIVMHILPSCVWLWNGVFYTSL